MAKLTPVQGNPFESGPKLTPVEGNPFSSGSQGQIEFPQGGAPQKIVTPAQLQSKERGLLPALKRMGHEFTGGDKEFDFPDISMADIFSPRLAAGLLSASDEKQVENIIRSNIQDAEINRDKFGKMYVGIPGKGTFYTEGLAQNLLELGGKGAVFTAGGLGGAATARAMLGPLASQIPVALGTGLGTSAASAGLDIASDIAGADQGVSVERAAVSGLAGFGAELAAPAIRALIGPIRSKGAALSASEAKEQLKKLGYDVRNLSDDAIKTFQYKSLETIDPAYAAAYAEAQGLPVPVKLTRGQITGNPMDQLTEDAMLKGVYGEAPRNRLQSFQVGQQQALRENIPAIQAGMSGGTQQVTGIREGGEIAAGVLARNAGAAKKVIDDLYSKAKSKNASVMVDDMSSMINETNKIAEKWSIGQRPEVGRAIDELKMILKEGNWRSQAERVTRTKQTRYGETAKQIRKEYFSDGKNSIDLKRIEEWRQKINRTMESNKTEGAITGPLGDIKRTVDDFLQRASDEGKLIGDQDAISAWSEAIAARSAYGREYQAGDIIERLTAKQPFTGDFKVDPRVAADEIFGVRGGFSLGSKFANPRNLEKIKANLMKSGNGDAWNALREEAFIRMAGKAEGAYTGAERTFSGVNFSKALDNALRTNSAEMKILFKPEEISLMRQLANVSARVTNTARNTSNTAIMQAGIIKKIMGLPFFREKAEQLLSILPGFARAAKGASSSLRATSGVLPRGATSGLTGGLGSTAVELGLRNSVMRDYENQ